MSGTGMKIGTQGGRLPTGTRVKICKFRKKIKKLI